jgi:hypothetical protein
MEGLSRAPRWAAPALARYCTGPVLHWPGSGSQCPAPALARSRAIYFGGRASVLPPLLVLAWALGATANKEVSLSYSSGRRMSTYINPWNTCVMKSGVGSLARTGGRQTMMVTGRKSAIGRMQILVGPWAEHKTDTDHLPSVVLPTRGCRIEV